MRRLVVIGGSSIWSASLIAALAALPPLALVLVGRDRARLAALAELARALLPAGSAEIAADPEQALPGADLVLLQVRWGGLEARAQDEEAARSLGCPADETLGPAACRMLQRSTTPLLEL